jgi:7-cyano-7-deazaguanine synthase
MSDKKAVILTSGGLDSATVLAMAKKQGFDCYTLGFDYGQRHRVELTAGETLSAKMGAVEHKVVKLDLSTIGGSALTDSKIAVPDHVDNALGVPVTYVPARNTVFLSIALGWAEVLDARDIFIGVNAVDYSGYPDCRSEYIAAFEEMANLATQSGVEGKALSIQTPLIDLSKADIIKLGTDLGVDYSLTVSCYQANDSGEACGKCDSCFLRKDGFRVAGIEDPTRYF